MWADEVSPSNAHPEYPRPQLVRGDWKSLNGLMTYDCKVVKVDEQKLREANLRVIGALGK